MGIFDFLKDEKREQSDSRRGAKDGFDLSNFSNNAELIDWIEENKVILLSEKDGLVVYTNDVKENFLQLYTSTLNVVDEDLDEYVEITGPDLRNLLEEMADISYLILNPSQENILIQRDEILNDNVHRPFSLQRDLGLEEDLEMTKVMNVPLDFNKPLREPEPQPIFSENDSQEEIVAESSLEDLSSTSNTVEENLALKGNDEVDTDSEEVLDFFAESATDLKEEALEENSGLNVSRIVPQSIIQNILKLSKEVQKFYLAENVSSDSLFFMAGTTAKVKLDEDLLGVTVLSQDGSEESFELENDKYLVFDAKRAKKLSSTYSETAVLSYFKDMPIVYPVSNGKAAAEENELTIFTDFSQIPDLFLNAFESFALASADQFREFLTEKPEIELIRLNPFTKPIVLRPDAFKSQKIEVDEENFGKTIIVEADKGKQSLLSLLTILQDFKLSNIAISRNEKKFTFEFASEKDVVIARQILKLKTQYQID